MKKILSILLALTLIVGVGTVCASAAEKIDPMTYLKSCTKESNVRALVDKQMKDKKLNEQKAIRAVIDETLLYALAYLGEITDAVPDRDWAGFVIKGFDYAAKTSFESTSAQVKEGWDVLAILWTPYTAPPPSQRSSVVPASVPLYQRIFETVRPRNILKLLSPASYVSFN